MFKKYRIKEVNGKFIPQVRVLDIFFFTWVGIDKTINIWFNGCYQEEYCSFETLEEALYIIKEYKEKHKPKKIKYHNL